VPRPGSPGQYAWVAALALALVAAASGAARAQRQPKTLNPRSQGALSFADLVRAHVEQYLGGLEALPKAPSADPLEPAVYVTVGKHRTWLWDQVITTDVAGFQAQVTRALTDELQRLRAAGIKAAPRVLVVADGGTEYGRFLSTIQTIARASAPAPADLRLAVRSGPDGRTLGEIAFMVSPPHPIRISPNGNPILLRVWVDESRVVVEARKAWLPWPESGSTASAVRLVGELKARDTNRTVMFVDARRVALPLGRLMAAVGPLRLLYPTVVFGGVPRVIGPAE
jgi:hypothetical protein